MLAVALAPLYHFGYDLIALMQIETVRVLKSQRRLAEIVGNYFQLAPLVNYLAHEA